MSNYNEICTKMMRSSNCFDKKELETIHKRIDAFKEVYKKFSESYGLDESKIRLNETILTGAIYDYFADIKRLKDFHKLIERVNEDKIFAYECYWFLRRKPIQLLTEDPGLVHINEKFMTDVILEHLVGDFSDSAKYGALKDFYHALIYHLTYRPCDPKSLELAIIAFKTARQVFDSASKGSRQN